MTETTEITQVKKPVFRIISKNKLKFNNDESDLLGFKVGDLITKKYGGVVIYEVLEINRLPHTDLSKFKHWETYNLRTVYTKSGGTTTVPKNLKIKQLIDYYQLNNNSGVCEIVMKCIFRKDKEIKKGKKVSFLEFDIHPDIFSWKSMEKVDFDKLIGTQKRICSSHKNQIAQLTGQILISSEIETKLENLRASQTK